jgi:predicted HicB family RNase H-like nuclease
MEVIEIELTDKEWLSLAMAAHEQDITLNQYMINILKKFISHSENSSKEEDNF